MFVVRVIGTFRVYVTGLAAVSGAHDGYDVVFVINELRSVSRVSFCGAVEITST